MNVNFALSCVMAAMWLLCRQSDAAPELVDSVHRRLHNRPVLRGYAIDELLDEEEEDLLENKRQQQFDDYGHMRFGKREKFDDYGHMRFGRRHD